MRFEPMLARAGDLPRGDYAYEVKWDGFRAIVSTEDGLRVWSRRGLVLDGELIVVGEDGRPSFPLLSQRVLHGWDLIGLSLMIFDVLRVDGMDMMRAAYADRRSLLDELELKGPSWRTPEAFDDGEALLDATSRHGLEGIVAKKRSEPYRPGERAW